MEQPRETVARLIALAGLGTVDGSSSRTPPNAMWDQAEWEQRILQCIPGACEERCLALADQILAALGLAEEGRPSQ